MSITFYPNYLFTAGFDKTAEPSITTQGYACSGGETTGPAYDLVDNRNSNVITIDTNGEATDFTVQMDLTVVTPTVNFVIVDNHNFETASANVKFQADAVDQTPTAYSGTLGSELTSESVSSDIIIEATDGILLATISGAAENNYTLSFTDNGGANYTADVTMGEVGIGISFSPTISPDINQPESIMYGNVISQSRGGQKYGVQAFGKRRSWTLGWKILQEADMTSMKSVWDICNGSLYPFWIDLGEGSSNPLLYYVRFSGDFNYTKLTNQAYSLRLTIEEEL